MRPAIDAYLLVSDVIRNGKQCRKNKVHMMFYYSLSTQWIWNTITDW